MTTIYLVVAYGGEYDDAWENNLFARTDRTVAELAVLELEARDARIKAVMPALAEQFRKLRDERPLPQEVNPLRPPKRPDGKLTKEARAEHDRAMSAWHKVAQEVGARLRALQDDWEAKITELQKAHAKELGLSDEDMLVMNFPTYSQYFSEADGYRVEELELL